MNSKRIIIIGAGPTGLGAAYRLKELGYENWAIYEQTDVIGGLSSSCKDEKGFTWDIGGHVMFSHNERFNRLADNLMGTDFTSRARESWIRLLGRWVPYPFQNNIRHLPKELIVECLLGLIKVQGNDKQKAANFKDWLYRTFGEGLSRLFLLPYNAKVWAVPLNTMSYDWIAERVSPVSVERVIRNIIMELDDIGWGPNSTFKFPLYGGTGGFFNKFEPAVRNRIFYKKKLASIDIDLKEARFNNSELIKYDILINTSPLDLFIGMIKSTSINAAYLNESAAQLKHNGIYVVGIGLRKKMIGTKCWVYSPEESIPFYRVTYFSHYSHCNVPYCDINTYSSLLCEISFSEYKPVAEANIVDSTVKGLVKAGILSEDDTKMIESRWVKKVDYAYPIPTIGRDDHLVQIQSFLEAHSIYSRGRFGAWKYEIGNMDHSVLMGIELIDRILCGEKENIWRP